MSIITGYTNVFECLQKILIDIELKRNIQRTFTTKK